MGWSDGVMEWCKCRLQSAECKMGAIGEFDCFDGKCGWVHGNPPFPLGRKSEIRNLKRMTAPPPPWGREVKIGENR